MSANEDKRMNPLVKSIIAIAVAVILAFGIIFLYPSAKSSNRNSGGSSAYRGDTYDDLDNYDYPDWDGGGSGGGSGDSGQGGADEDDGSSAPAVDFSTLTGKMAATPYATKTLNGTTEFGLKKAGNVGVVEKDFDICLYPIPSDAEFVGDIIDWDTFAQGDFTNYPEGQDNFFKLKSILSRAKANSDSGVKTKVNFPANQTIIIDTTYAEHGNFAYVIDDVNDLYLQGNGSKILLRYSDLEWRGLFYFRNCGATWVENLTVDFELANTLQGTVESVNKNDFTITVLLDKECYPFVERIKNGEGDIESYIEYGSYGYGSNKVTVAKEGGNFFAAISSFKGYTVTGTGIVSDPYKIIVEVNSANNEIKSNFIRNIGANGMKTVGNRVNVAFSYYRYDTLHYEVTGDVHVENVTVYATAGMGIVCDRSDNVFINRFRVCLEEGSTRLLTANADGIHIAQADGLVAVTNCLIEYNQDDALNIKAGYYYDLSSFDIVEKTITISKKTEVILKPQPGEKIEIYDREDFALKARLTVDSVTGTGETYTIKVKESLLPFGIADWGACVVTNVSTAKFIFKNNIVRNKRNRAILCQVRGAIIENNTFMHVAHGAIMLHSVLDNFNEAASPANIIVRNNKFIHNNYLLSLYGDVETYIYAGNGEVAPAGSIKKVRIENNYIADNGGAGIALLGTGDAIVDNNLLYNNSSPVLGWECAVYVKNGKDITFSENYVSNAVCDPKNFSALYMDVSAEERATIYLISNSGLEENEGTYEKPQVNVTHYSNGTISLNDNSIADWTNKGVEVEILGGSYGRGSRADRAEWIDDFEVLQLKVAWTDEGIYLMFDVRDDLLEFAESKTFWYGDYFELFLTTFADDERADMSNYKNFNGHDTMQLAMGMDWEWNDGENVWVESSRSSNHILRDAADIKGYASPKADGSGWYGELFLPFSVFTNVKNSIDAGNPITLNMIVCDFERDEREKLQVGNVPHNVETNKKKTEKSVLYTFVR